MQQVDDAGCVLSGATDSVSAASIARCRRRARRRKSPAERYDRGLTDFLNVLDAERAQYDLEERHVIARQAEADDLVALYKALGGGWPPDAVIPPIRPFQPALIAASRYLQPAPLQNRY